MFKSIRSSPSRSAVLVAGCWAPAKEGARPHVSDLAPLAARQKAVVNALETPGFKAEVGECITAGTGAVLAGLGRRADFTPATARTLGARLVKALDRMGHARVRIILPEPAASSGWTLEDAGRALGEGMALANWRMDAFDGAATRRPPARPSLDVDAEDAEMRGGVARGLVMGEAANYARRLGATPPNVCNPAWVAQEAKRLGRAVGLRVKVIGFQEAQALGMGGLVNVGKGSESDPCIIVLEHRPRQVAPAARRQHLVLVGKTLTYDTGGYSLKVNNGMKGMKYDKMGGMAVLGAMQAIAGLRLPIRVTAVLAAAENMVSGDSVRPDDIITMHNGATVEVTNTDAEGRLVLADALSWSCRELAPTAIVDVATLTGGVVVALGGFCAGYFCEDAGLRERLEAASRDTGEKLWRLPLWNEHRDFMRGQHADLINSNPARSAHPIQGAAFLSFFVDKEIPWAHVDIAGVANIEGATDLHAAGPTGWGVRLLTELAERFTRRG